MKRGWTEHYEPNDFYINPTKLAEAPNGGMTIARDNEVQPIDTRSTRRSFLRIEPSLVRRVSADEGEPGCALKMATEATQRSRDFRKSRIRAAIGAAAPQQAHSVAVMKKKDYEVVVIYLSHSLS